MRWNGLVNGISTEELSVADRGLAYGDGLFETVAVRRGLPCLWNLHLARLGEGARRLGIPSPADGLLRAEARRVIGDADACTLKIVLTRGPGGRGYRPPAPPQPSRILLRHPLPPYPPDWYDQGVAVTWCRTRLGENPALAGIKHLNRLEQVLARSEWSDDGIAEGLMRDGRGRVVCGTMTNLLVWNGSHLVTPRIDTCGVAGTARAAALRIAGQLGIPVLERDLFPEDLAAAAGLLLTNALIGTWPVRRLDGQGYDLGSLPAELVRGVRAAAFTPDQGEGEDACEPS